MSLDFPATPPPGAQDASGQIDFDAFEAAARAAIEALQALIHEDRGEHAVARAAREGAQAAAAPAPWAVLQRQVAARPLEDAAARAAFFEARLVAPADEAGRLLDRLLPGTRARLLNAAGLATLDALSALRFGVLSLRLRLDDDELLLDIRRPLAGQLPERAACLPLSELLVHHAPPARLPRMSPTGASPDARPALVLTLPAHELLLRPARALARALRERWDAELALQLRRLCEGFARRHGLTEPETVTLREALEATGAWKRLGGGWKLLFDAPRNAALQAVLAAAPDRPVAAVAAQLIDAPPLALLLACGRRLPDLRRALDEAPGLTALDVPLAWAPEGSDAETLDAVRESLAEGLDEDAREALRDAPPGLFASLLVLLARLGHDARALPRFGNPAAAGGDARDRLAAARRLGAACALSLVRCIRTGMLPQRALLASPGFVARQAARHAGGRSLAVARALLDETLVFAALRHAGLSTRRALARLDEAGVDGLDAAPPAATAAWLRVREARERTAPARARRLRLRVAATLLPTVRTRQALWTPQPQPPVRDADGWLLGRARARLDDGGALLAELRLHVSGRPEIDGLHVPVRGSDLVVHLRPLASSTDDDLRMLVETRACAEAVALRLEGFLARHPLQAAGLLGRAVLAPTHLPTRGAAALRAALPLAFADGDADTVRALVRLWPAPLQADGRGRGVIETALATLDPAALRLALDALVPLAATEPAAFQALLQRALDAVSLHGDRALLAVLQDAGAVPDATQQARLDTWHPSR